MEKFKLGNVRGQVVDHVKYRVWSPMVRVATTYGYVLELLLGQTRGALHLSLNLKQEVLNLKKYE